MMLAVEAHSVIALRLVKLMGGGRAARREASLMVSEKIAAALETSASLVNGASGDDVVRRYRQLVAANAKRLGKPKTRRGRLRRTRRRRKSA
jgi:hypothetical protein